MSGYRQRIWEDVATTLGGLAPLATALDFGSGDGFFAARTSRLVGTVVPVDVVERKLSEVRPQLYDGRRLPFEDRSFDLAYAVDVLHHCPDPIAALRDMARCSRRYLLVKDHICHGPIGKLVLGILDEVGNRRFGIPSPYLYQVDWQWVRVLESEGWQRLRLAHPMRCHVGPLGIATNRLQFMGLWERSGA